jgi:hypothetical protein
VPPSEDAPPVLNAISWPLVPPNEDVPPILNNDLSPVDLNRRIGATQQRRGTRSQRRSLGHRSRPLLPPRKYCHRHGCDPEIRHQCHTTNPKSVPPKPTNPRSMPPKLKISHWCYPIQQILSRCHSKTRVAVGATQIQVDLNVQSVPPSN